MKKSREEFEKEMEALFKQVDDYNAAHPEEENIEPPELSPEDAAFRDRMLDFDPEYDI